MQIDQKMSGDITVVHISGDITLNQGGDVLLKDKIQSLLQQGAKKIVRRSSVSVVKKMPS